MKKDLLLIAAAATMLTACVNTDTFSDYNAPQGSENDGSIGFSTFTSHQTKAENSSATEKHSLSNYQTTFKVWGYKNVVKNSTSTKERVFNADIVSWNSPTNNNTWQYSPIRFWDKQASSYEFYAAAPSTESWVMADGGNDFPSGATYKISLASFSLDGKGIAIASEASLPTSVSASAVMPDNKDIMISEDVTGYYKYNSDPVNLHFIHILSRINIGVKKDPTVLGNDYTVRLKSLQICQLKGNGAFNEATVATPYDATNLPKGTNGRWSDLSTVTKINNGFTSTTTDGNNNVIGAIIGGENYSYVYQALVIPQNIAFQRIALDGQAHDAKVCADVNEYNYYLNSEADIDADAFSALSDANKTIPAYYAPTDPYLVINYTITPTGKTTEDYVAYYNLAEAFGATSGTVAFNEGWMNTLNITISPVAIMFTADVYEWAEAYPSNGHEIEIK